MKNPKRKSEIAETLSSKLHELIDSFDIVKGNSINKTVNNAAKELAKQIAKKLKTLNTFASSEIEELKTSVKSSLKKMSEAPILAPKPPSKKRTIKPQLAVVSKVKNSKLSSSTDALQNTIKTRTPKVSAPVVETSEMAIKAASEVSEPKVLAKAPRKTKTVKAKLPIVKKKVDKTAKNNSTAKNSVVKKGITPKLDETPKTESENEVKIDAKPAQRVKRVWVRKSPVSLSATPKANSPKKLDSAGVLVASTSDKPGRPYTPRKKKTNIPK